MTVVEWDTKTEFSALPKAEAKKFEKKKTIFDFKCMVFDFSQWTVSNLKCFQRVKKVNNISMKFKTKFCRKFLESKSEALKKFSNLKPNLNFNFVALQNYRASN